MLAAVVLAGCSGNTPSLGPPATNPAGVHTGQRLHYGPDRAQVLDVAVAPHGTGAWVLVVHGGAWVGGRAADMAQSTRLLAQHGWTVFDLGYRLVGPGTPYASQWSDVLRAWTWIRAHAARLGVAAGRGAVWGHSAGGHLAAVLGNRAPGVRAVVSLAGVVAPSLVPVTAAGTASTSSERRLAGIMTHRVLGRPYTPGDAAWRAFDPATYLHAGDPPALLVQGAADDTVPPGSAAAYASELARAGVPHQVVLLPGLGHAVGPLVAAAGDRALAFLGRWDPSG